MQIKNDVIKEYVKECVKNTILKNELLKKGNHVVVGLSGGPDSMCLFYVLLDLKNEFELNISAVHVNHMLRPGDAEKDMEYVESVCKKNGIDCRVVVCDCAKTAREQGLTNEEAGRNIRYRAFYDAAKELITSGTPPSDIKIAVAQNKNDQAETLLMRIMRGTGVKGLSGIEYKREGEYGTHIIRPILDVARADIEKYCAEKNISPCIDHTNEEPMYTRNKIRLELIPYITANFNENIIDSLVRLTQNAKEDNEYLQRQTEGAYQFLKKASDSPELFIDAEKLVVLDRAKLAKIDTPIRKRAILTAFWEIGLVQDFSAPHLKMIDSVILSESASAKVSLPESYELLVSYNDVVVYSGRGETARAAAEQFVLTVKILDIGEYETKTSSKQHYAAGFDYESLKKTIEDTAVSTADGAENVAKVIKLRSREQGDYFTPCGMKTGKKKIQDYFVDRKIPKENREYYRLAAVGKEILWVFDPLYDRHNEINEKYKITSDTKHVLLLEVERTL